jgi:Big-like domain-containing protein
MTFLRYAGAAAAAAAWLSCKGSSPTGPSGGVASVTLSQSAATLIRTATLQLTATPRDAAGNPVAGQTIVWTTSAPGVAVVSATGLVTAAGNGTDTVTASAAGHGASAVITVISVSMVLDSATQLFQLDQPDALGMAGVPDMHTAILRQPDGSYRVWIAGRFNHDTIEGATGLLSTSDFLTYAPVGGATTAQAVLLPSCRPFSAACAGNFDEYYAGADWVYPASNGTDLLMLYHGGSKDYGGAESDTFPGWGTVGLTRSSDGGVTWTGRTAVISGSDAKPSTVPPTGIYGAVEPGIIAAGGYLYAYYAYFPLSGPSQIQVARAPVSGDGAAGTWIKYDNGFGSQPGLGGVGSPVIATAGTACTRPAQPWPVHSTYLGAYVLVFLCQQGWFFSTSTDLVSWTVPIQFFVEPGGEFQGPTDENVVLVTPGNAPQQIGQTGYALYAYTPQWGTVAHELYRRPFTFEISR